MNSTRERILQFLLKHPNSAVVDLAEMVGINAISVRHHLTSLMADGLVAYKEERHGVGRPRLVYFLTEKGLERFPTHYLRLTNELLTQLKKSLPENVLEKLFEQVAGKMADEEALHGNHFSTEERLEALEKFMLAEGFSMEWEKNGDQFIIRQIACPYYHIGQNHPEVCALGHTIISKFLIKEPEKISCILTGDNHCTFLIPSENQ